MEHQVYHQPTSFTNYANSNPSSTHSSPRSYPHELDIYQNPYPSSNPYTHSHSLPARPNPSKSASFGTLQVLTANTNHEEDPNERTARPGNAHVHAQFHSQTLPLPSQLHAMVPSSTIPMNEDTFGQTSDTQETTGRVDYTGSTPGLSGGLIRPLRPLEQERLAHLDRLKFFLATAPSRWDSAGSNSAANSSTSSTSTTALPMTNAYPQSNGNSGMDSLTMSMHPSVPTQAHPHSLHHPSLNRFLLPSQEYVTFVLWNGSYHMTGMDIVRALVFRFEVRSLCSQMGT